MTDVIAIGTGSAYPNDELGPAEDLANSGEVRYMCFDRLAERTLALAQVARLRDDDSGYDERLPEVLRHMEAFLRGGGTVIGNFGAANPNRAAEVALESIRSLGITGQRVGLILGDDVRDLIVDLDCELPELGVTVRQLGERVVSANAYIGAEPIVEALAQGATVVVGGRLADPSLFVAPIAYELGWPLDDWGRLGHATSAGHLLECGAHVTGGNFADPPYRVVPDLHNLAMPFAHVSAERILLRKLPGTGGILDVMQARSQLGYEILDPADYRTPDVTADFTQVRAVQAGPDVVEVSGASGRARPEQYKVLVGVDQGSRVVAEVSYGGPRCLDRAELAREVIERSLAHVRPRLDEIRFDMYGVQSLFDDGRRPSDLPEVRLRVAARSRDEAAIARVGDAVERMFLGPAGGGGITRRVERAIGVVGAYVPRRLVTTSVEVYAA